jgi:hypothetical protein
MTILPTLCLHANSAGGEHVVVQNLCSTPEAGAVARSTERGGAGGTVLHVTANKFFMEAVA